MMRFKSEEDYMQFLRLRELEARKALPDTDDTADPGPESVLAGKIGTWAKDHGYPILAFRQSAKARGFIPAGWPDCTLILPEGRTVFIELKSGKGRLRKEQKQLRLMFMALSHEYHVCKSMQRFLEIVRITDA